MQIVLFLIVGYLLGSIPFGYIIAKSVKIDITKTGSGNIGATNVTRTLGPTAGLAVFLLDMLKGAVAATIPIIFAASPAIIVFTGFFAMLGHMFSIFLRFKGGKGSAVGLGILFGIAPDVFFFTILLAILIIAISRYVSLASLIGSVATTVLMIIFEKPVPYFWLSFFAAIFIFIRHKENIGRLIAGTERKV